MISLKLRKPIYTSENLMKQVVNKTIQKDDKKKDNEIDKDLINNPPHYTMHDIEPLDVIESWKLGFHLGNCVKYIARCEYKGTKLQDLKKARFYLDRYIKEMESKENE